MKIGFDVSQTGQAKAGCGYVAHNLVEHLTRDCPDDQFLLYRTFGDFFWDPSSEAHATAPPRPNVAIAPIPGGRDEARRFWRADRVGLEDALGQPDVVHANNFFCPTNLTSARLVYTLYDLSFVSHPEWTTEENRVGCLRGVFDASLCADMILSISEFSKAHFLESFPHYPADRVQVFPLASRYADRVSGLRPATLPDGVESDRFWLAVGTIEPRKNYTGLLRAYARLKERVGGGAMPLVIAGKLGWMAGPFDALLDELGLRDDVVITGYIDDEELKWLFQSCFATVYPSFWEGFGLPPLEAMSQGAAVVTSDVSSLPEVVGADALLVDPHDPDSIATAMERLVLEPALLAALRARAPARAALFSWDDAARVSRAVYERALAEPPLSRILGRSAPASSSAPPSAGSSFASAATRS